MKDQGETRMTLEEYFGKECAESIKSLYAHALKSDAEKRAEMVNYLRKEAHKQIKDTVRIMLIKIAEQIESMESNQVVEDVEEVETTEKIKQ